MYTVAGSSIIEWYYLVVVAGLLLYYVIQVDGKRF
jgi:hypothetical protein